MSVKTIPVTRDEVHFVCDRCEADMGPHHITVDVITLASQQFHFCVPCRPLVAEALRNLKVKQ